MAALTPDLATAFARAALSNVSREYPHKLDHLLVGTQDRLVPKTLHPAFHGSFDWHSAVHMHWLLARLLRVHPGLPAAKRIETVLNQHLSATSLAAELKYFRSPSGKTFERPYGWAWLLELQAELLRLAEPRWARAVAPLASVIARRFAEFLAAAPYPIRGGSHSNTAFSCVLALDYARRAGNASLEAEIGGAAKRWYGRDRNAPVAFEPSLDDFLSPSLIEAVLMNEILSAAEFAPWIAAFFPSELDALATPPHLSDRSDPKQSHLDGLSLSRSWCFRRLGKHYDRFAERHLRAALPHVIGGEYAGEHWLATFAALALGDCP